MSDTDRNDEMEDMVAAWVLGALDADEAESIRLHVEGCASCREVAARLRRVVGALPLVVEEIAPPARLRERVLAAAAATPRAAIATAPVRRITRPRPIRLRPLPRIPAYAVAAVAVIALLAGIVVDRASYGSPASPTAAQVAHYTLSGHQAMSGAQATVIYLPADGLAFLDFSGLPQLAPGRVYEVWLIKNGANPVPAAVFVPDSNGSKVVLVSRALTGYSVMAVTDEAGPDGAAAPTEQPQLYGNLA